MASSGGEMQQMQQKQLGAPEDEEEPVVSDGVLSREPRSSGFRRRRDANGMPIRIPKLAVRNRTDDTTHIEGNEAQSDGRSSGSDSVSSFQRISTPSSRSASDETIPTRRSLGNQDGQLNAKLGNKKKKGGVLGFLTLKEPSKSAWAEFAEAEKEKAKLKGVDAAQKDVKPLPDIVPKVNSKWDGLPDTSKRKSMESKASTRGHRDSTFSTASRQSNWTAIMSASTAARDATRGAGMPPQSPRGDGRPSTQSNRPFSPYDYRPVSSDQPILYNDSALERLPIEASNENPPQTFLFPPSPEGHDKIVLPDTNDIVSPLLTPPELENDELRYPHELSARLSSDTEDPIELPTLPLTPPADEHGRDPILVGIHYPELDSPSASHRTASYDFGLDRKKSERPIKAAAATTRAGPKRPAINFSRPRGAGGSRSQDLRSLNIDEITDRPATAEGLSPTLRNSRGQIDPFSSETFAIHSRETGHIPQRVSSTVDPSSRAAAAAAAVKSPPTTETADVGADVSPDEPYPSPSSDIPSESLPTPRPDNVRHPRFPASRDPDVDAARSNSQVSLAPSETPSNMSESWNLSPKERLGFGGKVRKSEGFPWEEGGAGEFAGRGSGGVTSEALGQDGRRRRLSLRMGSRK